MNYNIQEAISFIQELYPNATEIKPIGHHKLKRHMVFSYFEDQHKFVIKLYFQVSKWNREVSALRLLKDSLNTPRVVHYGIHNDLEYLVMEYIDALVLEDIKEIDASKIYFDAGKQIAQIHEIRQFQSFGLLKHDLSFGLEFQNWVDYFTYESDRHIKNLSRFEHPNQDLIDNAVQLFLGMRKELKGDYQAVLTHNDFGARNIFIKDSSYFTIFDFEQSSIQDRYRELCFIQYRLDRINMKYFDCFLEGYKSVSKFDQQMFTRNRDLYNLHFGIAICSWSLLVDRAHYQEGIELIERYVKQKV